MGGGGHHSTIKEGVTMGVAYFLRATWSSCYLMKFKCTEVHGLSQPLVLAVYQKVDLLI